MKKYFTATEIAKRLCVDTRTVSKWCQKDYLKNESLSDGSYHITIEDFINFLYRNPKYYQKYVDTSILFHYSEYGFINHAIISRPPLYSLSKVSDIFGVTKTTVYNWIKHYHLKTFGKTVYQEPIFTENALRDMIIEHPLLRKYNTIFN